MFKKIIDHAGGFLWVSIIATILLLAYLQFGQIHVAPYLEKGQNEDINQKNGNVQEQKNQENQQSQSQQGPTSGDVYTLPIHQINKKWWIDLDDLVKETRGNYEIDPINGTVHLELFKIPFYMVKNVPVLERNGIYLPYELAPYFQDEKVFLPVEFIQYGLEVKPSIKNEEKKMTFKVSPPTQEVFSQMRKKETKLEDLSPKELIEYLSFLSNPIPGAQISTRESHLPGARREYRNGFHEGIDWYSGATGTNIGLDTAVRSVADGVVVRADVNYQEFTKEERDQNLMLAGQLEITPTYLLDRLRGRSVWVQYERGVMMRYAHLSKIEEGITVGKKVKKGEVLGYVGNSGTSFAVNNEIDGGLHLHADLLIYGELFWKYIHDPKAIREVLIHTFKD